MALVAVLMCVNFASCNDDDDAIELSAYSKEIVGKWEITSYAAMGTWHDSYVFNNDGTMIFITLGESDRTVYLDGLWSISNHILSVEIDYTHTIESHEYAIQMKSDEMHWQDVEFGGKISLKRIN